MVAMKRGLPRALMAFMLTAVVLASASPSGAAGTEPVVITLTSNRAPAHVGQQITFKAKVLAQNTGVGHPTGTVTFFDGATPIATRSIVLSTKTAMLNVKLPAGAHSITATYNGDTVFAVASSDPLSQDVLTGDTTTTLSSTKTSPTGVGEKFNLIADIDVVAPAIGKATGSATLYDFGNPVATVAVGPNGNANFNGLLPATGPHSYTVTYLGSSEFNGSTSAALPWFVAVGLTQTSVTTSDSIAPFGDLVTFTALVEVLPPAIGTATGTVEFYDGATLMGTGTLAPSVSPPGAVATYATSSLPAGLHQITAVFLGDNQFPGSTGGPIAQIITANGTSVVSSENPSVFGQGTVTFTATVSGSDATPTGTVQFNIDGSDVGSPVTLDGSGQATYSTSSLSVGTHPITATYSGDSTYGPSSGSVAGGQVVEKISTSTAVSSSPNPSELGEQVGFDAIVDPQGTGPVPTGTVDFYAGATLIGSGTVVDLDGTRGLAELDISTLPAGDHDITGVYSGDATFAGDTSPIHVQTVDKADTTTSVSSSADPSLFGESVTLTAHVSETAAPVFGSPTGTVAFYDNVSFIGSGSVDGSGDASITLPLSSAAGLHTITADYSGDGTFHSSTGYFDQHVNPAATTTSLSSDASPSVYGQAVTVTASVTAVAPGGGVPSGTVTFKRGSTIVATVPLDGVGQASHTLATMSVGNHTITATYNPANANHTSSVASIPQRVNKASTTASVSSDSNPSSFGSPVTFTAQVSVVAPGAAPLAGQTVTFEDGATVIGTGVLDGSGQATLTTSALSVGSHAITVVYGGSSMQLAGSTSLALDQTVT